MPMIIDSMQVEGAFSAGRVVTAFATQATANSTLTLLVTSAQTQAFTGTVAGQIVQLPSGLTLVAGQPFEIINLSTQPVTVQNGAGSPVILGRISQNSRARFRLIDASTAGGVWDMDNDAYGANAQYAENLVSSTNTSNAAYVTQTSLTPTNPLPLGNYILRASFLMGLSTANRIFQVRVTQATVEIPLSNSEHLLVDIDEKIRVSLVLRLAAISGSPLFEAQFKVSPGAGGTTVTCFESSLAILRES